MVVMTMVVVVFMTVMVLFVTNMMMFVFMSTTVGIFNDK